MYQVIHLSLSMHVLVCSSLVSILMVVEFWNATATMSPLQQGADKKRLQNLAGESKVSRCGSLRLLWEFTRKVESHLSKCGYLLPLILFSSPGTFFTQA